MSEPLTPSLAPAPELVFGLVAPIGADLNLVSDVLSHTLQEMAYNTHTFRLTTLMKEIPAGIQIDESPYIKSYRDRISYANEIRRRFGNDALAAIAISAIRQFREEEWTRRSELAKRKDEPEGLKKGTLEGLSSLPDGKRPEEFPVHSQAYVIRQFKRPEEIALMRSVYGRQFVVVSAYSSADERRRRIEELERASRGGLVSDVEAHSLAYQLVAQDAK